MSTLAWMRRWSFLALIAVAVAPLVASATVNDATLMIGRRPIVTMGITVALWGYNPGFVGGSYSPTGLGDGKTVAAVVELTTGDITNYSSISITGFTSDPGAGYLNVATCNGVTVEGGQATRTYNIDSGTVTYRWMRPQSVFGFSSLPYGTNVSCSIDHN